jgi:hypothetical protein
MSAVHSQPHLAAAHLGVGVGETEKRAGVIRLKIHHVASLPASAHIADHGCVASELAVKRERPDGSAAARELEIDAAHRLAIVTGQRAKLGVDIDVELFDFSLALWSRPDIALLMKPRPSNTSPRIVTLSIPSGCRSAFRFALSPSDGENVGNDALTRSFLSSISSDPLIEVPLPSTTISSKRVP